MTERIYTFYASILEGSFEEIHSKIESIENAAKNSFAYKNKNFNRLYVEPDRNDNVGRFFVVGELDEKDSVL